MTRTSRPLEELDKELFQDPETAALYLEEILKDGDIELFKLALRDVASAQAGNMTALSKETKIARESLYISLSKKGNPTFETLTKILAASGLRLSVTTA